MKKNIAKTLLLTVLVPVFALSFVSSSEARFGLKETYAVTGHDVCVGHSTLTPQTTYWTKTANIQGTMTFDRNGTGVLKLTYLSLIHPIYTPIPIGPYYPQAPSPASLGTVSTLNMTAEFEYNVDPATRLLTVTISAVTGTFTSGSNIGKWLKSTTPFTLTGHVPPDGKTIVLSSYVDADPSTADFIGDIEIYNDPDFTDLSAKQQDLCQKIRTLTWIKP